MWERQIWIEALEALRESGPIDSFCCWRIERLLDAEDFTVGSEA